MAEFPLDPQLAKMLVASPEFRWVFACEAFGGGRWALQAGARRQGQRCRLLLGEPAARVPLHVHTSKRTNRLAHSLAHSLTRASNPQVLQ